MFMDLKRDLNKLTKEKLINFLGLKTFKNIKKDELIEMILKKLTNKKDIEKLYELFKLELSVEPYELEQVFNINKNTRKKWTEKGYLPIVGYCSLNKFGKEITYPIYDRFKLSEIAKDTLEKWKHEELKIKEENRKKALLKALDTKKKNKEKFDKFKEEWESLINNLYAKDKLLAITYELAYWTVWISRWAKENQKKSFTATKYKEKHKKRKEGLYELKNIAIKYLLKTPCEVLGFYRNPLKADKIDFHLCRYHFYEYKDEVGFYGSLSIKDYFESHKDEIMVCPDCIVDIKKDYYSLFYLELKNDEIPDFKFSFHTPYPLGKEFFPDKDTLKRVNHVENSDGLFRFGRNLFENEKIIYKEKFVEKQLLKTFEKFESYFN